ncbi:MAG: hypothetical protein H7A24_08915 [Leptospiraceae bacterium]|nr:hypothetical protein [Leptospiraceae bacterium]MCP5511989.1 hypothetical protein [Leptospiraceae bacterium]
MKNILKLFVLASFLFAFGFCASEQPKEEVKEEMKTEAAPADATKEVVPAPAKKK